VASDSGWQALLNPKLQNTRQRFIIKSKQTGMTSFLEHLFAPPLLRYLFFGIFTWGFAK